MPELSLRRGELEGVMLLFTDQQLSCGFFDGARLFVVDFVLRCFTFFFFFLLPPLRARSLCPHTHTTHTTHHTHAHEKRHTCVQVRATGEIDASGTSKTHKHSQEGQITSGVFQRLQSKQGGSLSQPLYLCKEGKEEKRAFSWNPTPACRRR